MNEDELDKVNWFLINLIIVVELNGVQFWSEIIHVISKSNERAPLRQRILLKCVPHVQHETLMLRWWENETWKILEGDFSSVFVAHCFLGSRDGVVVIALASHLRGLGSSHDWVKLVVGSLLCSERFVSGFTGFPLSSKIKISKFQFDRMQDLLENHFRVSGASWVNINNYYNYYYGVVFVALPSSLFKLPVVQRLSFSRSQPYNDSRGFSEYSILVKIDP